MGISLSMAVADPFSSVDFAVDSIWLFDQSSDSAGSGAATATSRSAIFGPTDVGNEVRLCCADVLGRSIAETNRVRACTRLNASQRDCSPIVRLCLLGHPVLLACAHCLVACCCQDMETTRATAAPMLRYVMRCAVSNNRLVVDSATLRLLPVTLRVHQALVETIADYATGIQDQVHSPACVAPSQQQLVQ